MWELLDIRDGRGEVRPETREEFIPQMLNLQCLGGVSFKKGCYTGQEIVARMHYLGKLKRRMYRISAPGDTPPPPGASCQLPGETANVGHVVMAQRADATNIEILVVLTASATTVPEIEIDGQNMSIEILPLPYEKALSEG